ncbi:MAG: ATP-binding protein, partial [Pseudomonadota bacterium]
VDVSELPESYVADVKLIRQVISNLLSNAVKYSPEGERVWVSGKVTEEGDILIDVRDEGVGIPKDEVDKLFDRFFRASTSIGIAGTGIGLHLVKTLVDLHSGKVNVESTVGVGTVFSIILPGTAGSKMSLKDCEAAA